MNLKKTAIAVMAAFSLGIAAGEASAHATSIGYENAGVGSVNIWLGTYAQPPSALEGSLNLVGVLGNPFPSTTVAFTMLTPDGVAFKPAGLIDGVTNFYTPGTFTTGPLVGSEALFNAACPACGPVQHWQGVNFAGLGAGSYQFTYVPIAFPSAQWSVFNPNTNGIFDLTGVVNPVPEPATLSLLGLGLLGFGFARRRKAA